MEVCAAVEVTLASEALEQLIRPLFGGTQRSSPRTAEHHQSAACDSILIVLSTKPQHHRHEFVRLASEFQSLLLCLLVDEECLDQELDRAVVRLTTRGLYYTHELLLRR
jgi:hypothetical protein